MNAEVPRESIFNWNSLLHLEVAQCGIWDMNMEPWSGLRISISSPKPQGPNYVIISALCRL